MLPAVFCETLPLTISAAFTNVTRFIQRLVNLRGSTHRHGKRACPVRLGVGG